MQIGFSAARTAAATTEAASVRGQRALTLHSRQTQCGPSVPSYTPSTASCLQLLSSLCMPHCVARKARAQHSRRERSNLAPTFPGAISSCRKHSDRRFTAHYDRAPTQHPPLCVVPELPDERAMVPRAAFMLALALAAGCTARSLQQASAPAHRHWSVSGSSRGLPASSQGHVCCRVASATGSTLDTTAAAAPTRPPAAAAPAPPHPAASLLHAIPTGSLLRLCSMPYQQAPSFCRAGRHQHTRHPRWHWPHPCQPVGQLHSRGKRKRAGSLLGHAATSLLPHSHGRAAACLVPGLKMVLMCAPGAAARHSQGPPSGCHALPPLQPNTLYVAVKTLNYTLKGTPQAAFHGYACPAACRGSRSQPNPSLHANMLPAQTGDAPAAVLLCRDT